MNTSCKNVVDKAFEIDSTFRSAAFVLAVEKIATVYKEAGFTV